MSLRLLAVIALLCDPELSRRSDLEERFRELTDQALGLSFSRGFAGVVPRVIEERGTEFLASLLASEKRFRLRDAFDEDWFHNPRAAESLRDGLSRMPIRPSEADFRAGLSSALAWVRELGV